VKWTRVTHRQSGEVQNTCDPASYPDAEWEKVELDRRPCPDTDDFDPVTKKLRKCPVKTKRKQREERAVKMSRAELLDIIDDLVSRVEALEKAKTK
jgi:hypothetical protein